MCGRKVRNLSQKDYDNVRIEYEEIVNTSVIPMGDDVIDDVWNTYNIQKVTDKNVVNLRRGEFLRMKKQMISGKASRMAK